MHQIPTYLSDPQIFNPGLYPLKEKHGRNWLYELSCAAPQSICQTFLHQVIPIQVFVPESHSSYMSSNETVCIQTYFWLYLFSHQNTISDSLTRSEHVGIHLHNQDLEQGLYIYTKMLIFLSLQKQIQKTYNSRLFFPVFFNLKKHSTVMPE